MADENDKFEEEEYSGEEEYISEYEEPTDETVIEPEVQEAPAGAAELSQGGMSPQMKKMITWGVIGLGTVLVAMYLNFSEKAKRAEALDEGTVDQNSQMAVGDALEEPESSAAETPAASVPAEPEVAPAPAQVASNEEVTATEVAAPAPSVAVSPEVAADLAQEKARVTELAQRVKENQNMMSSVLIRLNTLEKSIDSLNETLKSTIKKTAKKPVVKAVVKPKPVAKKRSIHRVYGLKAILPGRAWIESASGDSRSIAIGDRIPGHGKVKIINAVEGFVLTTSGTMIVYGPGDF